MWLFWWKRNMMNADTISEYRSHLDNKGYLVAYQRVRWLVQLRSNPKLQRMILTRHHISSCKFLTDNMSVSCRWFLRWSDHHNHRYLELSGGAILDTRNLQAFQRLTRIFGHHPNIVFNIMMHHHSQKSKWLTMIMNSYLDNAVSTTVADCHIDWLQLRKNSIRYNEGTAIFKGFCWWSLYEWWSFK